MRPLSLRHILQTAVVLCVCCIASWWLAACQPAYMAVSPQLGQRSEMLQVLGRQGFSLSEDFSFGNYTVHSVDRGWTRQTSMGFLGLDYFHAAQDIEFVVTHPNGEQWQGICAVGVDQNTWRTFFPKSGSEFSIEYAGTESYVCGFHPPKGRPWYLAMSRAHPEHLLRGVLHNRRTRFSVTGTNELADTMLPLSDPSGYRFYRGAQEIAAVEVINEGRVFLPRNSPELQPPLAMASAALLLYRDLRK